ncbi:MAG: carbonic anhydrase [Muribaculaceae bacterium]|nr:carbonic anhydrase [Muribaculaceae bacterium]
MGIKSLIKSKKVRQSILRALRRVPGRVMLPLQYYAVLGRFPNIRKPRRFTEWVNWYKLYWHDPAMLPLTDKLKVRDYVAKKIGEEYLVPLLDVRRDAADIDFSSMPDGIVLKTTDGGNGDNVRVVTNRQSADMKAIVKEVNSWRDKCYADYSREWAYRGCDSKVIVEPLLVDPDSADGSIDDYKLLCFNGKFRIMWVDKNRYSDHRRGFWDENLKFLNDVRSDCPTFEEEPKLPANVADMVPLAEKLAEGFPFARIDFYNIRGKIYFGEITFYPWSGYVQYTPDEFDFRLGSYFDRGLLEKTPPGPVTNPPSFPK